MLYLSISSMFTIIAETTIWIFIYYIEYQIHCFYL